MTFNARLTKIMTTSAIALALAAPAVAQSAGTTEQPPAATGEIGDERNSTIDGATPDGLKVLPAPTDQLGAQTGATADELPTEPILTSQKSGQMLSDTVIGMDVRNPGDESIGTIDALVIDKRDRIVAGIVSVGGFLGLGAKDVAVNWREFRFQPDENVAVVRLTREQLEEAPAFSDREEQAQARVDDQRRLVEKKQKLMEKKTTPPSEEAPVSD